MLDLSSLIVDKTLVGSARIFTVYALHAVLNESQVPETMESLELCNCLVKCLEPGTQVKKVKFGHTPIW